MLFIIYSSNCAGAQKHGKCTFEKKRSNNDQQWRVSLEFPEIFTDEFSYTSMHGHMFNIHIIYILLYICISIMYIYTQIYNIHTTSFMEIYL